MPVCDVREGVGCALARALRQVAILKGVVSVTSPGCSSCRSVAEPPGGAALGVAGLAGVALHVAPAAVVLVGLEICTLRGAVPGAGGAGQAGAVLARGAAGALVPARSAVQVVPVEVFADPRALHLEAVATAAAVAATRAAGVTTAGTSRVAAA